MALQIKNVHSNIVGRASDFTLVKESDFKTRVLPILEKLQKKGETFQHKALIGKWGVELSTNDPHLSEFFGRNWKKGKGSDKPVVHCYAFTGVRDVEIVKTLRGIGSDAELKANLEKCLKELANPKYRGVQNDERMKKIEQLPHAEQLEVALLRPFSIYCSPLKTFVTINSNYYGQLKSKSSLGPLEEFLIEKGRLNGGGKLENPEEVWISMHAGSVEILNRHGEKKGVVLIAPTGTGKSTHGYGLVDAKEENRLHSDDWVFTNAATREVLISEDQFYMRTNIAEIFPHLIPLLVNEPLENVALTEPTIRILQQFKNPQELAKAIKEEKVSATDYERLVQEMIKTNAARSLIDPRIMVGAEKFIETTTLNFILLLKRDYMDKMICRKLTADEMIKIMTSKNNVFNYAYGKSDPDGYGIPAEPSTEIYYNPYLCQVEADGEKEIFGPLDKLRIAAYRNLAENPEVTPGWVNTRLRPNQSQFCLRKFLEGDADYIEVVKGFEIEDDTLQLMNLVKKEKEPIPERRMIDLVGLYTVDGIEVELVAFEMDNVVREYVAFAKTGRGEKQIAAYSEGNLESFFKHNRQVGAKELFPPEKRGTKMKILVTGATGFVGSHVVERLKKEGVPHAALVRASSDISLLKQWGIPLVAGDLQDPSSLDSALQGITHVIHCAAVVSDWAEQQEILKTNIEGTQALLEKSAKAKVERFVHVSSLAVLGMHDHHQTNETAPYKATGDYYCDTKIEAEKRAMQAYKQLGLQVAIVRPGFIYGPRDRQFLPRVLKFLKAGKFIYIGDGQKILNLTYIDNLVDAILLALKNPVAVGKIYNITDDGKVTRRMLIESICNTANLPKPTKSIPIPLAKVICTVCETITRVTKSKKPPLLNRARMKFLALNLDFDISKIRKELGYTPRVSLEQGMQNTIQWFKTSGKWDEI